MCGCGGGGGEGVFGVSDEVMLDLESMRRILYGLEGEGKAFLMLDRSACFRGRGKRL